jgi:Cas7 group CRISPR-associated protein Csh2
MSSNNNIRRATGLLIVEVRNSNPNGDPDRESDPRRRSHDRRGIITGVSFKRKLRDLIEEKEGDVWNTVKKNYKAEEFGILESPQHKRAELEKMLKDNFEGFKNRFWDARIFGNTFLEEGGTDTIRSGVAQFGLGLSVAQVEIDRMTMTKKAPAQKGKDGENGPSRGMAPLGYRVIEHGVYCMPFFINPTCANKSGCQLRDIALMLKIIPYAYPHTRSAIRPFVEVRHAWYAEHDNPLGSFSDFHFIDAMTPSKENLDKPSKESMDKEYTVPKKLPDDLKNKVKNFCDLCESLPDWYENV